MRAIGTLFIVVLCACALQRACTAQQPVAPGTLPVGAVSRSTASLSGTVVDQDGSLVPGAHIEVVSGSERVLETADDEGEFYVYGLAAGTYTIRVIAEGFTGVEVAGSLLSDEQRYLQPIALRMTGNRATVTVYASQHEVAAAEVAAEEKQRVFGVIPNFYVVYSPHPAPLSARQKFHLAWRSTLDPFSFLACGIAAGIEQDSDDYSGYGQGAEGYAKRYAASFTDGAVGTFLGGAILPSIFHQDPRYYYQGTGSFTSRARHAMLSVVVTRGDNGKRQFNYSNVLGTFATAGISNAYYPASDRNGAGLTMGNAAIGLATGAVFGLMQEFVVPKLTPHLPKRSSTLSGN